MDASSNKTIAKNSVVLYLRMVLSLLISLYTSRVILNTLGVEDYGIYNVAGSVVALFTFLNGTMSGATTRFLTIELGRNDMDRYQKVFSSAFAVHVGIAVFVLVVAETVGLWLLNQKLVIPDDRMFAAQCVYQLSILTAMVTITQVPYNASIVAHERMTAFAYIDILNVTLRLLIVFMLVWGDFDRLILYGCLMFLVSVLITVIYRTYCIRQFRSCRIGRVSDHSILRAMLSFFGWDLYGNMSVMARTQGVNMLLNMFFGAVANAAAGIAAQVAGGVGAFSTSILTAVRPQIIKSYAAGNYGRMFGLMSVAARLMCMLSLIIMLPLLVDTHFVLTVWLKTVPDYAVVFCQFVLVTVLFDVLTRVLNIGIHATGRIRRLSLINGTLYLMALPLTYVAFRGGLQAAVPYLLNALFMFIGILININTLKRNLPALSVRFFLVHVVGVCLLVAVLSGVLPYWIRTTMDEGWMRFGVVVLASWLSILLVGAFVAANREERSMAIAWLRARL